MNNYGCIQENYDFNCSAVSLTKINTVSGTMCQKGGWHRSFNKPPSTDCLNLGDMMFHVEHTGSYEANDFSDQIVKLNNIYKKKYDESITPNVGEYISTKIDRIAGNFNSSYLNQYAQQGDFQVEDPCCCPSKQYYNNTETLACALPLALYNPVNPSAKDVVYLPKDFMNAYNYFRIKKMDSSILDIIFYEDNESEYGVVGPTTFYVLPDGIGSGTECSDLNPCNLSYARQKVLPRGVIYLMNGSYGVVTFDAGNEKGSNWSEPITYKAYFGADPIIEELYINDVGNGYLVFDRLHFQGPDRAHSRVVQIEGSSRHIKILNCEAEDREGWLDVNTNAVIQTTDDGVEIPQDITVNNCDVHRGRKGIGGSAGNFIITNNHVHYISDSGIKVGGDGPVLIENNHVHNQDVTLRPGPHGTGISVRSINTVIRNNTIHDYGNSIVGINFYNDGGWPSATGYINMLVENNLIYDPLDGKTEVAFETGTIGNNFTFRNNTIIGYLNTGSNYGYRFGSGVLVGLDTSPPTPFHSTYTDGEFKFYNNIVVGHLAFFNGQADFDRISEGNNLVWALLHRGEPFYEEFSPTSTSKVLTYGSTVGGYMIHGDPEDYFEGSGNFFKGGADFDAHSYTLPGGNSHGVNLNDAYVPVEGSDVCSGGIITKGHLAGQSCALGGQPTTFYVSPIGNGSRDGSDAANAMKSA